MFTCKIRNKLEIKLLNLKKNEPDYNLMTTETKKLIIVGKNDY